MNLIAFKTIYKKEMQRTFRVPLQSLLAPSITTILYFVVFGAALGASIKGFGSVGYSEFIVPGLIMMSLLTSSLSAASTGIYVPRFMGSIYELLSAPISYFEITLAYVMAAVTRALLIAFVILFVSSFFVDINIAHPFIAFIFAFVTAFVFGLFGFIIGIWAENFEKLNIFPMLIITPLSFLGGVFYSIDILPGIWKTLSLFNPVVYMISGLRWSFFDFSYIDPFVSFSLLLVFLFICSVVLFWIFKTGYKLKN